MRRTRQKLVCRTAGRSGGGPPRVIEDVELYHQVMANASEPALGVVAELADMVRLSLEDTPDWGVAVMALRARLFLGCIRKEQGRRSKLDPNQLRLLEVQ